METRLENKEHQLKDPFKEIQLRYQDKFTELDGEKIQKALAAMHKEQLDLMDIGDPLGTGFGMHLIADWEARKGQGTGNLLEQLEV